MNTSGIKALGHAVLVEPYEPEIKKSSIIIPNHVGDRTKMVETRAVVVHIGNEAWKDESEPRAKPGDKVLISMYAGVLISPNCTKDGKAYRMVNDRDIYAAIEE